MRVALSTLLGALRDMAWLRDERSNARGAVRAKAPTERDSMLQCLRGSVRKREFVCDEASGGNRNLRGGMVNGCRKCQILPASWAELSFQSSRKFFLSRTGHDLQPINTRGSQETSITLFCGSQLHNGPHQKPG